MKLQATSATVEHVTQGNLILTSSHGHSYLLQNNLLFLLEQALYFEPIPETFISVVSVNAFQTWAKLYVCA